MKKPIDLDHLPRDRRDWLEVFGNQWGTKKQMPGTCEACVWGQGKHAATCTVGDYELAKELFKAAILASSPGMRDGISHGPLPRYRDCLAEARHILAAAPIYQLDV